MTRKQALVIIGGIFITTGLLAGCKVKPGNISNEETGLQLANPTGRVNQITPSPLPSPTIAPDIQGVATTAGNLISPTKSKEATMATATILTSKGNIIVKLYPDSAPKTVANFESKAKSDYYKNMTFHRVEDWVIQGGDPLGTGTGGGTMPTEFSQVAFKEGSLGVARGGNRNVSNDSQFFVCTKDCAWLTGEYTNFGEVISGMDVAKKIAVGDKILGITLE